MKRHIDCGKAGSVKISTFFCDQKKTQDLDAIRAEALFTSFLVEHNIALSAADHAGKLFRNMFPGNRVAQVYACGRTKTTAIMKCCAREEVDSAASAMRNGSFIIGTDGSQEGGDKFFPVVVRFINDNGDIATKLIANPTCSESATGENIFHLIEETFSTINVGWDNCLALVCDHCNTMTGKNKGVISFIRRKVPSVHLAGCVCHLLNLAVYATC